MEDTAWFSFCSLLEQCLLILKRSPPHIQLREHTAWIASLFDWVWAIISFLWDAGAPVYLRDFSCINPWLYVYLKCLFQFGLENLSQMASCQGLILIASEGGKKMPASQPSCCTGQEGTFLPENVWPDGGHMNLCTHQKWVWIIHLSARGSGLRKVAYPRLIGKTSRSAQESSIS